MKFRRPDGGVLHTEVESGLALLDATTNTYFLLNKTGSVVWMHLDQEVSLDEICAEVAEKFDVTQEACRTDVQGLLDTLVSKGFVVAVDEGVA